MSWLMKTGSATVRMVRKQTSRAYFTGAGWSRDPLKAKTFADLFEAAKDCAQHQLAGVELVVRAEPCGADLFQLQLR